MHACSPREAPVYQILPPEIDDLISMLVMGAWGEYLIFLVLSA